MAETTISTKKHILTYGVILGFIWVIYGFLRHITDNGTTIHWGFSIFELSLYIGFIFYSIYKYKSKNDGFLTLWQALKVGFGIVLISVVMQTTWDIFLVKVVSPETIQEIINSTDKLPAKELQESNKTANKENNYLINIFGLVFNLVLGTIIALFAGAIMQKNKDPFE
ncbi:DUF4199 domain-containing protein [Aquimarina sp. MMG016]|uniref:DUF4199 domain-containing protein n=1 Tax=Aquimarina sp. MMG016 TaxID=2822690 RepID=UPI001B3A3333|nr:DUF4199 domain-containing protein [Aquimarina sp. MMG016]MBQ4821803.1 DUF4199 domain-containing protein [Aquimarina sp. MMG016]